MSLHGLVTESLGRDIVAGVLPAGFVLTAATMCERFGASRTAIREAMRVLEAMGLVEARQRIGTRVRSAASWHLLHPAVVRWRSASSAAETQMREFREVGLGLWPSAARRCAERLPPAQARQLASTAKAFAAASADAGGTAVERAALDREFHARLLEGAANRSMLWLGHLDDAAHDPHVPGARGGALCGWSVDDHEAIAQAIVVGDPDRAEAAVRLALLRS